MIKNYKVGFIGAGNLAQALIKSLVQNQVIAPENIYASNRTDGKLIKLKEQLNINTCKTNEELVESSDIVVISVKPQDFIDAIEPISQNFNPNQIVISVAAGISMKVLEKYLPQCIVIRLIPNTPTLIGKGVVGYLISKSAKQIDSVVESLFSTVAQVIKVEDEDSLEALMVGTSSAPGFIFELMMYWVDWLEEHGFSPVEAKQMTIQTFLGSAELASKSQNIELDDLQNRVASKKGITAAGLNSMRELEIERALRISFEKACLRNQELEKTFK